MNYLFRFCILIVLFSSCSKPSELSKDFNCGSINLEKTTEITDFNKNFKLHIPTSWNTAFYYNNFTSEIFTADTIKQLTKTYILDASYNLGEVIFNQDFLARNDSISTSENLEIIKANNILFQSKEGYYFVSKGFKNKFPYHKLNLTVKLSPNTYFNSFVEVYGNEAVDDRICEAIAILDNIEFLQ